MIRVDTALLAGILSMGIGSNAWAGSATVTDTWSRLAAPDGSHSAELPCNAQERAQTPLPTEMIRALKMPPQSIVACEKNGLFFISGVTSVGLYSTLKTNLFDQLTADGARAVVQVNGHRATFNRQVEGSLVAQSGFVELDRTRVVSVMARGEAKDDAGLGTMGKTIDRCVNSIREEDGT